jgi:hypothetical protein
MRYVRWNHGITYVPTSRKRNGTARERNRVLKDAICSGDVPTQGNSRYKRERDTCKVAVIVEQLVDAEPGMTPRFHLTGGTFLRSVFPGNQEIGKNQQEKIKDLSAPEITFSKEGHVRALKTTVICCAYSRS